MKLIRQVSATVLLICIAALVCLADHLPDELIIPGVSEHKLCGIDIYRTHVQQIKAVYGQPTSTSYSPLKDTDTVFSEYVWQKSDLKLRASVYRGKDGTENEAYVVDVWGSHVDGQLGMTSQGIKLGCTIKCIQSRYGKRYMITQGTPATPKSLLLEWKDGTHLIVNFDSGGKINHMQLMADVE